MLVTNHLFLFICTWHAVSAISRNFFALCELSRSIVDDDRDGNGSRNDDKLLLDLDFSFCNVLRLDGGDGNDEGNNDSSRFSSSGGNTLLLMTIHLILSLSMSCLLHYFLSFV